MRAILERVIEEKGAFGVTKTSKREQQEMRSRESTHHSFSHSGMITTYFTFPILDCSPLFPAGFGFILVLKCGHLILCIFVKSKTNFYSLLLILVWLI